MRALIPYVRRQWRPLAVTFLVATIARLFLLADPQILRLIIDRYVLRLGSMPREQFVRGVLTLIALTVIVAMLARVFRIMQEYWIALIARRIGASLYVSSISQSLLLPYSTFETLRSGQLLHTIQRARDQAESGINGAVRLYLGAVAIAAITIYAFTVHPLLGALHLFGIPVVGLLMFLISNPIRQQQRRITRDAAALAGSATEAIRNVELVKSLGVEVQQIDRLTAANDELLELERAKLGLIRRFTFVEGVLYHGMRAVMLLAMLWLLYRREITTGEFLTLFLYANAVFMPLSEASEVLAKYQEARASFDTLSGTLDSPRDVRRDNSATVGDIRQIAFRDVTLRYSGREEPALRDVNVTLKKSETVAFVGPSGAGKSSIVKLLVGLYLPSHGVVSVNDTDLASLDLDVFRARVGFVTQETQLFAGTIRENLLIARPDASDSDCLRAIDAAAVRDVLNRGGEGLDTRVGEGGIRLSGGERQRIAIARALIRQPDVLVFDEATSSLDSITETSIVETIRAVASAADRITVLVAHRLSTVAYADRIHVLSDGRIVESGTHPELLDRDGIYAALWREQTGARAAS